MKFPNERLILTLCVLGIAVSCSQGPKVKGNYNTMASGLKWETIREGTGDPVQAGQAVLIHEDVSYTGGKYIYSTRREGKPVQFTLGQGMVIAGLDEGVQGMKPGEYRRLVVPPKLSKRTEYPSNIHPDSTLVYVVELLQVGE